jgi:hypothetical protein
MNKSFSQLPHKLMYLLVLSSVLFATTVNIPKASAISNEPNNTQDFLSGLIGTHNTQVRQLIPGTAALDVELEKSLVSLLQNATSIPEEIIHFAVTDVQPIEGGQFVSIIGLVGINADLKWNLIDNGAWFGLVFAQPSEDHQWVTALEGTAEFAESVWELPDTALPDKARMDLTGSRQQFAFSETAIFPWEPGTSMIYSDLGVHDNGFSSIVSGWKAVDFLSNGNTGVGDAPNRLLAALSGTITYKCNPAVGNVTTAIKIGDMMYTHLMNSSNLSVGRTFTQGQQLGTMKTGSFNENCGYANQQSYQYHVHFGFPNNPEFTAGGWTLRLADQKWRRGSETKSIGARLLAESGCDAYSVPLDYAKCADEGGRCSFSGTKQVYFGANNCYQRQEFSGGVDCNSSAFGDLLPGTPKACYIQQPNTCPTITDWKGEYWDNTDFSGAPVLCRNESEINFDWAFGSPDPAIPSDHFAGRWTRSIEFPAGEYEFIIFHDDGVRLKIDGNTVFEDWNPAHWENRVRRVLTAGVHEIVLEMYENEEAAAIRLDWQAVSSTFSKINPANNSTNRWNCPNFTWQPAASATSYRVCYDRTNDGVCNLSPQKSASGTSYRAANLIPGATYFWQVQATNGSSTWPANGGNWWKFTVIPLTKVSPSVGATNVPRSATLTWSNLGCVKRYEVCVDRINNNRCDTSWQSAGTSTKKTLSLAGSTVYYWQVRAIYSNGAIHRASDGFRRFRTR